MKPLRNLILLLALGALPVTAAESASSNYRVPADSVNSGGRKATSASYAARSSLGGIGGVQTSTSFSLQSGMVWLAEGAPGATYTWNVSSGDWSVASNWTPNGVPGATDTVVINNGGSVTVSSDTSVSSLNFTNGTLTGAATLTVADGFNWAGGTITGTGTLTLLGSVSGTISGNNTKFLDGGRVLNNQGTLVWTGTGQINLRLGTWDNSGLLDCQNDTAMNDDSGSGVGSFFNNTGTVRKSAGTGTTTFGSLQSFANSGTVEVQSGSVTMSSTPFHNNGTARSQAGTLTVASGGTGGGTFEAVSPGLVTFTGGTTTLTNSARLMGTGTNRVAGATVTVTDTLGVERLEVTGGTFNGAGTVTVTNGFHWSGGTISGTGTLTLLATVNGTLGGSGTKFLDGGRVFNNQGTLVWTGTTQIRLDQGTWNNSGLLDCQSNDTMSDGSGSGAGSFFNNTGTVRKSAGTGITTFGSLQSFANGGTVDVQSGSVTMSSTPFHNNGTARTQAGTLTLGSGGGTGSGTFEAVSPGLVSFTAGTHTLTNSARLIGTGTNRVAGATVTVTDTLGVDRLEITGGTLNGAGTVTVTNEFHWSGGTVGGTGTLTLLATVNGILGGSGTKFLDGGRVFNNQGTLVWTGTTQIRLDQGTWNNSGVLDCQSNDTMSDGSGSGAGSFFNNTGTLRKSVATGTTTFSALQSFANSGTVEVQSGSVTMSSTPFHNNGTARTQAGILTLGSGGGTGGGSFEAVSPGLVSFTAGTHTLTNSARLMGTGTNRVAGATMTLEGSVGAERLEVVSGTVNGTGTVTVTNEFHWSGGTISGTGTLTLLGSVNGTIGGSSGKFLDGGRVLNNAGTLVWTGTGQIGLWLGTWNNSGLLDCQSNDTMSDGSGSGVGSFFNNIGTLRKSVATGTTTFSALQSFANSGTVEVLSGILSAPSTYSMTGSGVHRFGIGGTTAGTGHGRLQINGATTLDGALEAVLVNGFNPAAGNTFLVITFTSRTGTFASFSGPPGTFTDQYYSTAVAIRTLGAATYTWDGAGANWADPTHWVPTGVPGAGDAANIGGGTVMLSSGTTVDTLNLSGGGIDGSGVLTVATTLNWSGGSLNSGKLTLPAGGTGTISGASAKSMGFGTLNNEGTLTWTGSGQINFGQGVVTNSGLFEIQNDSSYVDTFDGAPLVFHNSGIVRKTTAPGTTTFNSVSFTNYNGGLVEVQSGSVTFGSGSFNNHGTARALAGTLNVVAGGTSGGTFEAGGSGLVAFTGGTSTLMNEARLMGTGTNRVAGATVTITGNVGAERLEITSGTLNGTGTLNVTNDFYWSGGTFSSGTIKLLPGGTGAVSGSAAKGSSFGTLDNAGTLLWTGTGAINFGQSVWTNSGVFEIQSDSSYVDTFDGAPLVFHNSGVVRKTTATATTTLNNVSFTNYNGGLVEVQSGSVTFGSGSFNNHGTARAQTGTLNVNAGGTSGGTFEASGSGLVAFTGGTTTLTNGARLMGLGTNRLAGATVTITGNVGAERLAITGGTVTGAGSLTITNGLQWSGGSLGLGAATLLTSGVGTISGASAKSFGGLFHNQGSLVWTDSGPVNFSSGTWTNSGVIELQSDATFVDVFDGAPLVIQNSGTLRKVSHTGTTAFNNVFLTNSGTVDIRAGILSLGGNYAPASSSTHRFAVGGYAAGTGFGRLSVSGTLTLAGQLDLMLTNSFTPTNGATFAIVAATSRSGTFSSVTGRGIAGGLYFNPTYLPGGVTLTVADGTPSIAANSAAWVDGKFQFRLNGVASETYRVDASTNLANWSAISTNVLSGSAFFDFVDNDSPTFPHRFYRAVFLP